MTINPGLIDHLSHKRRTFSRTRRLLTTITCTDLFHIIFSSGGLAFGFCPFVSNMSCMPTMLTLFFVLLQDYFPPELQPASSLFLSAYFLSEVLLSLAICKHFSMEKLKDIFFSCPDVWVGHSSGPVAVN